MNIKPEITIDGSIFNLNSPRLICEAVTCIHQVQVCKGECGLRKAWIDPNGTCRHYYRKSGER
ncbi:MAG: hypothetical protein GY820_39925 [Gammaproteobacteria bacterium]|nr:hypothetical protein [Gammaproteobacteria bacterium]